VGYAFQVVDAVPEERHDRRMDGVMTERGIRWAEGGR
jgi:5-formyltetrahydrofolate cyclo-ligase